MLEEIGSKDNIPAFIKDVKARGRARLMGFGHRVYKNYDPRAKVIKQMADQVFEVTGKNPLLDIALELERIALEDEYFVERKLYPNVDFYSGHHLPGDGLPDGHVPGAVRDRRACRAGSRSGRRCSRTRSRRSRARARSTWAPAKRDYVPVERRAHRELLALA